MLHLATELFLCMKSFSVSNAIPTCLDKTPLIVNIRKAEVRCLWRKSHVRHLDRTRAHTGCCSPGFLFDFLTSLQVSAQTCCWEVALCWVLSWAQVSAFLIFLTHIKFTSRNYPLKGENTVQRPTSPTCLNLHNSFLLSFLLFSYLHRIKWLIIRVTITQRESFSYLGKH